MKPIENDQNQLPVIKREEMPGRNLLAIMSMQIQRLQGRIRNILDKARKVPFIQLLVRTVEGAGSHDVGQRAAGVAYYAIISIFPLLLGLIAVFGFFLPSVDLQDTLLKFVGNNIPGATNIIKDNIAVVIRLRGVMSILSFVILFWGASAWFGAISLSINRAWDIIKNRQFLIRKASEIGMVFGTGILFLLSLGASAVVTFMRGVFNMPTANLDTVYITGRVVAFLFMFAIFLLLYKFVPNVKTQWRHIWLGALLAAVFFELARSLFLFYLANFANYQIIYGSITSIIVLLIWIYYSSLIIILGAEFTFQYSRLKNAVNTFNSTAE
jgi:membrane protein